MEKKYWKGIEELRNDAEFVKAKNNEFLEHLPMEALTGKVSADNGTSRRDFLKFLGFGVAAATLASCEAPVKKTIPYLIKPEEITPGIANWYASTYADGKDYCSIIVKTREGRPIKIESNNLSGITGKGTNARVQASVLGLYDSARVRGPLAKSSAISWDFADKEIINSLSESATNGKKIRILSSTIISPSLKSAIKEFSTKYPNTKHVSYDAVSYAGIIAANNTSFNKAVVPSYRFDKADIILSFGADFLLNWLSPIEYSQQYVVNRKLAGKKSMSRHIQVESLLSVTGSNADKRISVKPSEQALAIHSLYNKLTGDSSSLLDSNVEKELDKIAKELLNNKGKSLVVSGSNDANVQVIVNAINSILGNYGSTIDLDNANNLHQGDDVELALLIEEMKKGEVGALIIYNSNPLYTLPPTLEFKSALSKVKLKVAIADREDETVGMVDYLCPDHHYLEAWTDAEPKNGSYSLGQPTISPLFNTRSAIESFLKWSGYNTDAHSYISNTWKGNIFNKQQKISLFETFWSSTLRDGIFETNASAGGTYSANSNISAALDAVSKLKNSNVEIALYEKAGVGTGNQANNPWLQELPDPISRICWDNYATVSAKYAKELGIETGDYLKITVNGVEREVPAIIQPGQAQKTIGLALGYGRTHAGKAGNDVGVNAYPFVSLVNGNLQYHNSVKAEKIVKEKYAFAATQTHHTLMGRDIVKETTLSEYNKDPKSGNPAILIQTFEGKKLATDVDFWEAHEKPNHQWGLAIDLNSCIGCGSCVVSCNAENNVPVVGRDEIRRGREMHWIRIDRYYSSEGDGKETKDYAELEVPLENPSVLFQPMTCQHCNHAPCETVCPVAATTHSSEGLNQMAYNRCVGTRYCANNCPYKVRRFNWFKYSDNSQFDFNMNDDLGKMVLNPDVVVRSRGVMEKCTMCVQRIQLGKLDAKKESRRPVDGEINTACAQACPTNAIIFGDFLDKDSTISKMFKDERSYHVLGELNVKPSVFYQTKVRNV